MFLTRNKARLEVPSLHSGCLPLEVEVGHYRADSLCSLYMSSVHSCMYKPCDP